MVSGKSKNMIYNKEDETIALELDDFKTEISDYKQYGKGKSIIDPFPFKEYFTSSERIIICNPIKL